MGRLVFGAESGEADTDTGHGGPGDHEALPDAFGVFADPADRLVERVQRLGERAEHPGGVEGAERPGERRTDPTGRRFAVGGGVADAFGEPGHVGDDPNRDRRAGHQRLPVRLLAARIAAASASMNRTMAAKSSSPTSSG